ncbi:hypothetical protein OIU79_020512, partial [Salix purpurea]
MRYRKKKNSESTQPHTVQRGTSFGEYQKWSHLGDQLHQRGEIPEIVKTLAEQLLALASKSGSLHKLGVSENVLIFGLQ